MDGTAKDNGLAHAIRKALRTNTDWHGLIGDLLQWRVERLNGLVRDSFKGRVGLGLFKGVRFGPDAFKGSYSALPMMIGCYEDQLHAPLRAMIARDPVTVINVGAAEGYYAVGLALALPGAEVIAFETEERTRAECRALAALNGVEDRIDLRGLCTRDALRGALERAPGRCLVLMDVEGAEDEILEGPVIPALRRSDLVIELHDHHDKPGLTKRVAGRLAASHSLELLTEGPRAPALLDKLRTLSEHDRWLCAYEGRTVAQNWLVALAKDPTAPMMAPDRHS